MSDASLLALPGRNATRRSAQVGRPVKRYLSTLRVVREGRFAAPANYPAARADIRNPSDVFAYMAPYAEREVAESFWLLALDAQHRVSADGPAVISRGILDSTLVHPREVFRVALILNAAAIIVAHNHPSGDPTPSPDDLLVTHQLVAAGRLLDMPVHDHVVLGDGRYVSFAEARLL